MKKKITPVQTLSLGYIAVILLGAILLSLPFSSVNYQYSSIIDSLFTSASAVSTTGLAVVDTGSYYSTFGQIVIITLVQIGGLGYMIFFATLLYSIGFRFTINGKKIFNESIARPNGIEIKRFVKAVILFTLSFEFLGAVAFFYVFIERHSFADAIYSAVFHSVSAFCTAGFSLYADSFTYFANDFVTNLVIATITIAGGIGFFVLYDVARFFIQLFTQKRPVGISDHSKLVLLMTSLLVVAGTTLIFFAEGLSNHSSSCGSRIYASSFQAISASTTTGFNTVDIGAMNSISIFCLIILMFIGASPGGTGGGIKTSTFGIIILYVKKIITANEAVSMFRRNVSESVVERALVIAILAGFYLLIVVIVLSFTEQSSILKLLFETVSALGTVGLSMGITSDLTVAGKLLIALTMAVGRIGPLAIGYSLIGKPKNKKYSYPDGTAMVG